MRARCIPTLSAVALALALWGCDDSTPAAADAALVPDSGADLLAADLPQRDTAAHPGDTIQPDHPLPDILPDIVSALPLNRLLIETDAPFLTPHPHRGKRNEPAYVRLVAEKIADVKNLSLEKVAQATTANARALFQLDVP